MEEQPPPKRRAADQRRGIAGHSIQPPPRIRPAGRSPRSRPGTRDGPATVRTANEPPAAETKTRDQRGKDRKRSPSRNKACIGHQVWVADRRKPTIDRRHRPTINRQRPPPRAGLGRATTAPRGHQRPPDPGPPAADRLTERQGLAGSSDTACDQAGNQQGVWRKITAPRNQRVIVKTRADSAGSPYTTAQTSGIAGRRPATRCSRFRRNADLRKIGELVAAPARRPAYWSGKPIGVRNWPNAATFNRDQPRDRGIGMPSAWPMPDGDW